MAGSTADVSVELIVEVLKHAPAELNPTEKLTLVVIAESCRTESRMTFYRDGWDATELARRVGITAESLTKVFRSLAAKGCEVRVPHMIKDGKPIFAFKGKQTTFKLPRFAPQRVDESPGFSEAEEAKGWTSVRQSLDESPGNEPQSLDESPPLLLKDLPSKNTSSLSARETTTAPAPIVPSPRTEREIEDASQKLNNKKPTDRTTVLLDAGLTNDEADRFAAWADTNLPGGPKGDGWYLRLHGNGTLAARIADWRSSPEMVQQCTECDDTGEVGDYLNRRPCACIWWKDEQAARSAFIAQLKDFPDCDHGMPGGDVKAPNGWQHCALCRGPGWRGKNEQPRTGDRDFKPSTAASRARQGLAVADQLDREYGHGKYAARKIRSPADQRIADGAVLYEHYRRLELEGESA